MGFHSTFAGSDAVCRGDFIVRALERNKQSFWYALYNGETELTDEDGNYTGDMGISYGEPVQMKANISAAKGSAGFELFGSDLQYSKTIVTTEMDCPITEESALWIGENPTDEDGNDMPHNYVVRGIAKSLNSIVYAIAEADRS